MHKTRYGTRNRIRSTFLKWAGLAAVGLLALGLSFAVPAGDEASTHSRLWRERDWQIWFQSHQLYQREPEELSQTEIENVQRWSLCLLLVAQHEAAGNDSLTGDECQFVVDALGDLAPNLEKHGGYLSIYEACRRRLDGEERAVASSSHCDSTRGPAGG